MGSGELIPFFALLEGVALTFPMNVSLSQPMSSLTLIFLILLPISPETGDQGAVWCFLANWS